MTIFVALDAVSVDIRRGERFGLIGPNGSGKTTFFNVATGIYGANAGHITFDGVEITSIRPRRASGYCQAFSWKT